MIDSLQVFTGARQLLEQAMYATNTTMGYRLQMPTLKTGSRLNIETR